MITIMVKNYFKDANYCALHQRIVSISDGSVCFFELRLPSSLSVSCKIRVSYTTFRAFNNYELPFVDLLDIYTKLIVLDCKAPLEVPF